MLNQENSNSYSRMLAMGLVALASTASAGATRAINFLHQGVTYQLRVSEAHGLGNMVETAIRSGSCGVEFINSTMSDAYIMRDDIIESFQSLNSFQITEMVSRHQIESFEVIQFLREQTQHAQENLLVCMNDFLKMATDTAQNLANDQTWNSFRAILITAVIFAVIFGIVSCLYIKSTRNDLAERRRNDRPEEFNIVPRVADKKIQENNRKNLESFLRMTAQEQELFDNIALYQPYLENAENFYCPIGRGIMKFPVTVSTGHSYECEQITAYFDANPNPNLNDPLSQIPLESKELRPNWDLKKHIITNLQAAKKKWENEQKENTTPEDENSLLHRKNR